MSFWYSNSSVPITGETSPAVKTPPPEPPAVLLVMSLSLNSPGVESEKNAPPPSWSAVLYVISFPVKASGSESEK